jgi:hypothetical protein
MPLVSKTVYVLTACSCETPAPSNCHWLQYLLFDLPYLSQILLEDSIFFGGGGWNLTPRLWASSCRRFVDSYCLRLQGQCSPRTSCLTLKVKAVRSFETSGITLQNDTASHPKGLDVQPNHCETFQTCTFYGVRSCECDTLWFGRKACFIKRHGIVF